MACDQIGAGRGTKERPKHSPAQVAKKVTLYFAVMYLILEAINYYYYYSVFSDRGLQVSTLLFR